ncbi:hypothetical protein RZQ59_23565, partial [Klebsiella pneumoniae]|nr:hypothetical protein [Klebsiella pneumoniae]MDV1211862.1 hypothetical protein [Klebsiella pneumoniae]MDV1222241.1 hypothetical protein [Klebsiella pneumoniae]MDV1227496.1 hypothetical protein [Klebsiella pneumoniae]MDV1243446.1 hypothetical protein [Klebsiella pneumoniae]
MSQNWMRHFELQLIDDKGDGISLSDFKVTFNIQKMPATIFNGFVGNFKIYNLSPETQNRIMGKEFTRVRAIAGYNGTADSSGNYPDKNVGIIFKEGANKQVISSQADSLIKISRIWAD